MNKSQLQGRVADLEKAMRELLLIALDETTPVPEQFHDCGAGADASYRLGNLRGAVKLRCAMLSVELESHPSDNEDPFARFEAVR